MLFIPITDQNYDLILALNKEIPTQQFDRLGVEIPLYLVITPNEPNVIINQLNLEDLRESKIGAVFTVVRKLHYAF